jgi:hypothetical protein
MPSSLYRVFGLCLVLMGLFAGATQGRAEPEATFKVSLPLVMSRTPYNPNLSVFGVAPKADLSTRVDQIRNLQPHWVRASVRWDRIEPQNTTPDRYDWSTADRVVQTALSTGGNPVLLVWYNPAWAATTACGPVDRVSAAEVAQFIQALVERYDGDGRADASGSPIVNVFEFYNEPDWNNTQQDWLGGCWGQYGAAYAAYMQTVWTAAHAASNNVVVLNGSVAAENIGNDPSTGRPYFNFSLGGGDFIDAFLRAGGGRYIDGLNIHYFHAFHKQWATWGTDIIGKARYYQEHRLRPYNLQNLPLYATEVGMRSDASEQIDGIPGSQERQRDYVAKVYVRAMTVNFRVLTWFTTSDEAGQGWGMLNYSGQPKLSYHAFRTMVSELPGARWAGPYNLPSTAEGYRFQTANGSYVVVLWSRSSSTVPVSFQASRTRVAYSDGRVNHIQDGQPGDYDQSRDGTVTIEVGETPIYVRVVDP